MTLPAGQRLGPYEIVGLLGAGGMGEVYRARDARLGRDVALKVVTSRVRADADAVRRFELEARAAAALNHPNVLAVHDVGTDGDVSYVVSELLEGDSLRARLAAGPLAPRKVVDYAAQIVRGLAAAHAAGIVHRDLKPENVFVTHDERVKILDFGLAKLAGPAVLAADDATGEIGATGPGTILGTVGYMSPEQVRAADVDRRSDIFSFGAVLFEMLSGRRAFGGESAADVLTAILREEPADILPTTGRAMPPALERIARRCLEKRPDARFQTASDLVFALEAVDTSTPGSTEPAFAPIAAVTAVRRRSRVRWLAGGALLLAIAAAATATLMTGRASPFAGVEYRRVTFRSGELTNARFTPDGQSVVYSASWGADPSRLFVARLDNPESRPLGLSGVLQSISATGDISFLKGTGRARAGTMVLARVPLGGGAPRDVAENVIAADWGPDGAEQAIVRARPGGNAVELPINNVIHSEGSSRVRLSPDGQRVVTVERDGSGLRVVVVDRKGAVVTRSRSFEGIVGYAWNAGGAEVLFSASDGTTPPCLRAIDMKGRERLLLRLPAGIDLFDRAVDGRLLLALVTWRAALMYAEPGLPDRDLAWMDWSEPADLSADGRTVLFTEAREGGGRGGAVYLRRVDEDQAVRLGEGDAQALSHDGLKVIARTRGTRPQLVLLPTGAGDAVKLPPSDFDYQKVRFLPDGRRIAFVARNAAGRRLYVQDLPAGAPRVLSGPLSGPGLAISPDGARIAVFEGGVARAYDVESGAAVPLPGVSPNASIIGWSADAKSLFAVQVGVATLLLGIDLETGRVTELRRLGAGDASGVTRISPVLVSQDGSRVVYSVQRQLMDLYVASGVR